jgi:hypothetical protein
VLVSFCDVLLFLSHSRYAQFWFHNSASGPKTVFDEPRMAFEEASMAADGVVLNKKISNKVEKQKGSKSITSMKFGGKGDVGHTYAWRWEARDQCKCVK